ncbi:uncharacterized protein LOC126381326 [Pectinophora gossypiella]|uniref:uncharacterized protein LOC126381326 n=1 Tax=Pectinophora gossypiella TaxID=13191 RepID=UPI00214EA445|nr:uncharacterized protein LOC126381326 [Pectinophora gossypiella]
MFGQKKVVNQSANQIKALLDTTTECINSLKNLKITTDSWDPVIVFLIGQKLDTELLKDWEEYALKENNEDMPTWEEMRKFLESKFRTLELIAPMATSQQKPQAHKSFHVTAQNDEEDNCDIFQAAHANVSSHPTCTYCNGSHYIFNCKDFAKQTVTQRQDHVKKNRLCYNCLVPNHMVFRCKQKTTCRLCKKKHHSLLHQARETNQYKEEQSQIQPQVQSENQPEPTITTAHFSRKHTGHDVLLATAQVEIKSRNGETHILRALIDQGSEASFVSARVVELLNLQKTNINGVVSGVGEGSQIALKHLVDLSITPRHAKQPIHVKAYVLKTISTRLPSKHINMNWPPELLTIELADPTYHTPGKIDLLLGADVFCKIIEDGLVRLADGIVAQKTSLGWILSGQRADTTTINSHNVVTLHITRMVVEDNEMLRRFWELESALYKKKKILTKEEEKCEEIYSNTTKRDESGRYIVHLPLKQTIEETINICGETKQQAVTRFKHLEKKFEKSDKLKTEYKKVIEEYKEMGHLRKSDTQHDSNAIYLPHHAVIREDKDTTKVRVVYDASAKGSNGHSLNEAMMVGPVLQPDLRSLITTWRTHMICVVGDIMKMYRMINMTKEHTNLQRIVWRDNQNEKLESYNLTTVTFGTAAAPYLAVRTLAQVAEDESLEYPDAAKIIRNSFYMDDLMAGNENVEKTKKMCEEVRTVLERGGFKMQKWSSNSEEVLEFLQREDTTKDTIEIKLDKIIKILGLTWDRKNDEFEITVYLPQMTRPVTKRSILSDVARLFDPFGWLSPVIISAKVLIQKLWLCSLGWDDELPINLREEWMTYRDSLIHLQTIKIPRWFKTTPYNNKDVQLHGFADASTQAYAAVTYLRVVEDPCGVTDLPSGASPGGG